MSDFDPSEYVTVPEGWSCKRLADCTIDGSISYGIVQPGQHNESGIPVIRVNNINNGRLDLSSVLKVSPEVEKKYKRTRLKGGEVLLTLVGSTGQSLVAPEKLAGWNVPRAIAVIRVDEGIGANWINICLQSKETMHFLNVRANTTVQKTLNLKDVRDIPILIPPKEVKESIEGMVLSLSDKIELNRQTNQTLEHIAQAIFKSWFVDFEPTRAKIVAKQEWAKRSAAAKESSNDTAVLNEQTEAIFIERSAMAAISGKTLEELNQLSQEQQGQLKTTAALFPDALIDSELGEIPEEWEIKLNGDVMDVRDGTHDSPKKSETGFPLVTSKHITSGVLKIEDAYLISEVDFEKVNERSQVNQGDILLTMIGTVGIPYLVSQTDVNFAIKNVGLFRTSEVKELKNYFYLLLRSPFMKAYLDARIAGTTQKYLSLKTLRSLELLMPSSEVLEKFNFQVDVIMEKLFSAIAESRDLKALRDTLLPKLLSGELTIASTQTDLEKAV